MIKLETLRIPANYVLVKANEDYETYQIDGRDTGIRSALSLGTAGQRISVYGKVVKVPQRLVYSGADLAAIRSRFGDDEAGQAHIDRIKKESVLYDVPVEIKPGDDVMFIYKNQLDCYKEGRVLYTEDGPMMLMKYDTLKCVVLGPDEIYPLNAAILVKKIKLEDDEVTAGGLIKIEQQHMGMALKKKISIGLVMEAGCLSNGYLEFPLAGRDKYVIKPGDYIYYDGRMGTNLEYETHQLLKTPRVMIRQKDVWGIIPDPSKLRIME